jgi:tetratricopeptide (TPR) repeat protein
LAVDSNSTIAGLAGSPTQSPPFASSTQPITRTAPTTGLNDAARRVLGAPLPEPNTPEAQASDPAAKPAAKHAFEASGYSADPLELGRAYYRREKFEAALIQFESQGTNIEATYWKARCLERLNKPNDAIAAYNQVIASPTAGGLVTLAKDDLEFLKWRIAFEGVKKTAPVSSPVKEHP